MYVITYKKSVEKDLRPIPKKALTQIVIAIQDLAEDPIPAGCSKLKGRNDTYRIRIGNYRVIYSVNSGELIILIVRVAHRKEVYKNL